MQIIKQLLILLLSLNSLHAVWFINETNFSFLISDGYNEIVNLSKKEHRKLNLQESLSGKILEVREIQQDGGCIFKSKITLSDVSSDTIIFFDNAFSPLEIISFSAKKLKISPKKSFEKILKKIRKERPINYSPQDNNISKLLRRLSQRY